MKKRKKKIPQQMLPSGFVGWMVSRIMPLFHKPIYRCIYKALDLRPEDDLVEVACGSGYFLKHYASHVHSVAGLDLSEIMVKGATRRNKNRVASMTAEFVKGEASQLPWKNDRFSAATIMGSFIGFPEPLKSLREIFRVLRPGGRVILSIEWNAEDGLDHSKKVEHWGMRLWKEDEVRAMMEEAGFSGISFSYAKAFGMPKMMIACGVK